MRRLSLYLFGGFLFLIIWAMASGCHATKYASDVPDMIELEDALLWKIEGNDLAYPSFIFGTIHIIPKNDFFFPPKTLSSLDACDRITFEVDMSQISDLGAQMELLQKSMMADDLRLSDLLEEDDYQLVSDYFKDKGMPLFFFERIKPMFLTVLVSDEVPMDGLNEGSVVSYEFEFLEMAEAKGMQIGGLETLEFQMSVFDSIPYKEQAIMLVETIRKGDDGDDLMQEMFRLYKAQDLKAMGQMMESEEGGMDNYLDLLLNDRNQRWIPIMEAQMTEMPTFFAVGAGHLGGGSGVLQLLHEAGYDLTPLNE